MTSALYSPKIVDKVVRRVRAVELDLKLIANDLYRNPAPLALLKQVIGQAHMRHRSRLGLSGTLVSGGVSESTSFAPAGSVGDDAG